MEELVEEIFTWVCDEPEMTREVIRSILWTIAIANLENEVVELSKKIRREMERELEREY